MKWIFLWGLIIIFPFTFLPFVQSSFSTIPFNMWLSVAFVVFGATILGYFLNNYSLKTLSPSINGIYIYLQPLIAAIVSIVFGKDTLSITDVISALLIMAGVYFVTRPTQKSGLSGSLS